MANTVAEIAYRPLRIAWAIDNGDANQLREAITWNTCIWGGVRNYIFQVDDLPSPVVLAKKYAVDAVSYLNNPKEGSPPRNILEYEHKWCLLDKNHHGRLEPSVIEAVHFFPGLSEEVKKDANHPITKLSRFKFDQRDSLGTLIMTKGCFPATDNSAVDYKSVTAEFFDVQDYHMENGGKLPKEFWLAPSYLSLTNCLLTNRGFKHSNGRLLFIFGSVSKVKDMTLFWNVRATGAKTIFIDVDSWGRFEPSVTFFIQNICEKLRGKQFRGEIGYLSCESVEQGVEEKLKTEVEAAFAKGKIQLSLLRIEQIDDQFDNRYSTRPRDTLGFANESDGKASISFAISDKPFDGANCSYRQHFAVDIQYRNHDEFKCYSTPFIPELNEFFGRQQIYFTAYDRARPAPFGLSVLSHATDEVVSLRPYDPNSFFLALFEQAGFQAAVRKSSHVVLQLIQRLGGIEGFRALKIEGVRKLISKLRIGDSVTRSEATKIIFGNHPNHELKAKPLIEYDDFGIKGKNPTPHSIFEWLVDLDLLMPGISIECPNCNLDAWISLDELKTNTKCKFCAKEFRVGRYLKGGNDWKFRKSGLLSRDDNQEGGIPVGLALQALNINLEGSMGILPYSVGIHLSSEVGKCEIDFCCLYSDREGVPSLIIGEAKDQGGEIEQQDLNNLISVAQKVEESVGISTYVCVAKTGTFTLVERSVLKEAKRAFDRLIILSQPELERLDCYSEPKTFRRREDLRHAWDPEGFVYNSSLLHLQDGEEPVSTLKFISYFDKQLKGIESVPTRQNRKILYSCLLDTIAHARFSDSRNRVKFIQFLKECCDWTDADRVSAPQLLLALKRKNQEKGKLYAHLSSIVDSWEKGHIIRPERDPTLSELGAIAVEGEKKFLEEKVYSELFYSYRNHLVHNFREPGYGMEMSNDGATPYYHSMSELGEADQINWQLVFPVEFFHRLCTKGLANLEVYLKDNKIDPYALYPFGDEWLKS